jgi:hypothetical protein
MPLTSRFPLSPGAGQFVPSSEGPTRPFGLRFGVRPVELGKHSKKPTNKTKTEATEITDDGQVVGTKPDTIHYIEMDEE